MQIEIEGNQTSDDSPPCFVSVVWCFNNSKHLYYLSFHFQNNSLPASSSFADVSKPGDMLISGGIQETGETNATGDKLDLNIVSWRGHI